MTPRSPRSPRSSHEAWAGAISDRYQQRRSDARPVRTALVRPPGSTVVTTRPVAITQVVRLAVAPRLEVTAELVQRVMEVAPVRPAVGAERAGAAGRTQLEGQAWQGNQPPGTPTAAATRATAAPEPGSPLPPSRPRPAPGFEPVPRQVRTRQAPAAAESAESYQISPEYGRTGTPIRTIGGTVIATPSAGDGVPAIDVQGLTENVIREIDRRMTAYRERQGKR